MGWWTRLRERQFFLSFFAFVERERESLSLLLLIFFSLFLPSPSGGPRVSRGTPCRRGRASLGPRTQGPCSLTCFFVFVFVFGGRQVREKRERGVGVFSKKKGEGVASLAASMLLSLVSAKKTLSPPRELFSVHKRIFSLSLCMLSKTECRKKERTKREDAVKKRMSRWGEEKKHSLFSTPTLLPLLSSPQRAQLPSASGQLQRRPPRLAGGEEERSGHIA